MTTQKSVAGADQVTISQAQLDQLMVLAQKAERDRKKRAEYRKIRNARPEVKLTNAEAHEKRNRKIRMAMDIVAHLIEGGYLTEELLSELQTLDSVISFTGAYPADDFSEALRIQAD